MTIWFAGNRIRLPVWVAASFAVIATAALMRTGLVYCAEGSSLQLGTAELEVGPLALMLFAYSLRLIY